MSDPLRAVAVIPYSDNCQPFRGDDITGVDLRDVAVIDRKPAAEGEHARPALAPRVERTRRGPWIQVGPPRGFEWNRVELPVPRLPRALEGLRMVHFSDLHLRGRWSPVYDELAGRINDADADLLLFTGDFVDSKHDPRPAVPLVGQLFSRLRSRLGTFAILGNHDTDLLAPHLPGWNVTALANARLCLQGRGANGNDNGDEDATIELIFLPGADRADLRPEFLRRVPSRATDTLRVVLGHFPDMIGAALALRADLYLCGHSHGGQVCLPGGWPPITHDSLPRRFCKGIHRIDDLWMVANRGLGCAGPEVRVFCPAEVMEICLSSPSPLVGEGRGEG